MRMDSDRSEVLSCRIGVRINLGLASYDFYSQQVLITGPRDAACRALLAEPYRNRIVVGADGT